MSESEQSGHGRFDKWWKDLGQRKLLGWQFTILVSQMTTGYDESVVGSLQAMAPWIKDMGNPNSARIGLITAIVFVGGVVGATFASPVTDHFGRRAGMLIGAVMSLIGTIIQTAAQNSSMFIGGRFLIGIGINFSCVAGPALLLELAHPATRGTIVSLFNSLWYVGSILAAWTTFGTGYMMTTWSWRIPCLIQAVPPLVVLISVIGGMPESPRWLLAKGRPEEAQKLLAKYHSGGDSHSELVLQEIEEIKATLEVDRLARMNTRGSWSILYRSPANRKRIALIIIMPLSILWCGQGVISYYFSPILKSIGITSTPKQTGINGGLQIWNLLCSLLGAFLADRIGRRPLWFISYIGMICANIALTVSSAMYSEHGSKAASYVVVIFLFLYDAAFNLACNPLLYSYPTEILPYPIRAKGLSIQAFVSQAGATINQYVNPIALDHIGFYYYIFYLGMLIFATLLIYFVYPETKDKSEFELATLFDDVVPLEGLELGLDIPNTESIEKEGAIVKSEAIVI